MLRDIVIDTNVLVDSNNPKVARFNDSIAVLTRLVSTGVSTELKLDPGFSEDEARNRSKILSEYYSHLSSSSLAQNVLALLFSTGRVKSVISMPPYSIKKKINQIIRNKVDRCFLCVAICSDEGVFVSHDFVDFQAKKRGHIKKNFGVDVIEASVARNKF